MSESAAESFLKQAAISYRPSGEHEAALDKCPFCGAGPNKFFVNISGGANDGLCICFVCGHKGNLTILKGLFGVVDIRSSITEVKKAAPVIKTMFDPDAAHKRLMEDEKFEDVLNYLVNERGFSLSVLVDKKIGAEMEFGKKWVVIPYFGPQGRVKFVKYRTVPPEPKQFRSTPGVEVPLYNEDVIVKGLEELFIVEGEADCLAMLSAGFKNTVGVPGAAVKKATWIERLDNALPKKIYLIYDRDKAGQDGAKELAKRLGFPNVYNVVLPEFNTIDGTPGKDINEWFRAGHTAKELLDLLAEAKPVEIRGVKGIGSVLESLIAEIEKNGTKPPLDSPWPSLNLKFGGADYGDVVAIMAEGKIGKTTMALNWLHHYAKQGINCLMYCLEMPPTRLVRKWCSYITMTDDTPGKSKFTVETVKKAADISKELPGDMYFGFTQSVMPDTVMDTIRQCVRRYGVKVVAFDNLQFLVRSVEYSVQETAKVSKQFKELAMELGILILLIVQPNRPRDGEIIQARNAYGASAIEKDVDSMIILHRNPVAKIKLNDFKGYLSTDQTFEPQVLCKVDLSRYAAGGACTLWIDGGTSTIREMTPNDNKIKPVNDDSVVPVETEQPVEVQI